MVSLSRMNSSPNCVYTPQPYVEFFLNVPTGSRMFINGSSKQVHELFVHGFLPMLIKYCSSILITTSVQWTNTLSVCELSWYWFMELMRFIRFMNLQCVSSSHTGSSWTFSSWTTNRWSLMNLFKLSLRTGLKIT